jgi:uncharacterized protein (DUF1501 family)
MNRRGFLKLAAAAGSGAVIFGPGAWMARAFPDSGEQRRLIVLFLRGAVDGLNVVAPYGERPYYDARPAIAIAQPAIVDLDGHFGLHPALSSMMPMWRERTLAFVHACGSPDSTRSHFDAQDYMESATPGVKVTSDGWLNRVLAAMPGPRRPTEAINLGPVVPRILSGRIAVANMPIGRGAARPLPLDRPGIEQAFSSLYQGRDPLSRAFQEGYQARRQLLAEMGSEMQAADNGAPHPDQAFTENCAQLGHLMAHDPSIRVAFAALGGWDTHVNEGGAQGQLADHLKSLGDGLATLARSLGPAYHHTVILVMSEFGRTVRQNGNGGTDHGHGNVMWVAGGPVRGGKIYGNWPGLDQSALYQGRDLAVTTDFRAVLNVVVGRHLAIGAQGLRTILPGFAENGTGTETGARSRIDELIEA